jgi:hypothetical protein
MVGNYNKYMGIWVVLTWVVFTFLFLVVYYFLVG